jgi:hypothetical protein
LLAFASFGAKRYADGVGWASRALNDQPNMIQPHVTLTNCFVGANEIAKARAVFAAAHRLAPEYLKIRLEGKWTYGRPEDRKRSHTFLRIAAGLEDATLTTIQISRSAKAEMEILKMLVQDLPSLREIERIQLRAVWIGIHGNHLSIVGRGGFWSLQ